MQISLSVMTTWNESLERSSGREEGKTSGTEALWYRLSLDTLTTCFSWLKNHQEKKFSSKFPLKDLVGIRFVYVREKD